MAGLESTAASASPCPAANTASASTTRTPATVCPGGKESSATGPRASEPSKNLPYSWNVPKVFEL